MKNKLVDLNKHLFAQLERLGDEQLTTEALDHEVRRAHAIASASTAVMKIASLQLRAAEMVAEYGQGDHPIEAARSALCKDRGEREKCL